MLLGDSMASIRLLTEGLQVRVLSGEPLRTRAMLDAHAKSSNIVQRADVVRALLIVVWSANVKKECSRPEKNHQIDGFRTVVPSDRTSGSGNWCRRYDFSLIENDSGASPASSELVRL